MVTPWTSRVQPRSDRRVQPLQLTMMQLSRRLVLLATLCGIVACHFASSLESTPELTGRAAVNFVIGGDGHVSAAVVQESSLPKASTSVAACIADAIKTWHFPAPQGGDNVIVTYPFNLSPDWASLRSGIRGGAACRATPPTAWSWPSYGARRSSTRLKAPQA